MALREVDSLHDQMCAELDRNITVHNQELVNILKELNSSSFTDTSLPPIDVLAGLSVSVFSYEWLRKVWNSALLTRCSSEMLQYRTDRLSTRLWRFLRTERNCGHV